MTVWVPWQILLQFGQILLQFGQIILQFGQIWLQFGQISLQIIQIFLKTSSAQPIFWWGQMRAWGSMVSTVTILQNRYGYNFYKYCGNIDESLWKYRRPRKPVVSGLLPMSYEKLVTWDTEILGHMGSIGYWHMNKGLSYGLKAIFLGYMGYWDTWILVSWDTWDTETGSSMGYWHMGTIMASVMAEQLVSWATKPLFIAHGETDSWSMAWTRNYLISLHWWASNMVELQNQSNKAPSGIKQRDPRKFGSPQDTNTLIISIDQLWWSDTDEQERTTKPVTK